MQLPLQLTIQGWHINLIGIGLFLFIVIYMYYYWTTSREKMKPVQIFDVVFIGFLFAFITSRILSVLFHFENYLDNIWLIFNFSDGNYFYIGIFLGLIFSAFLIYNYTDKERVFSEFITKVVTGYALAVIPLLTCVTLAGEMLGVEVSNGVSITVNNVTRMPVNIFRIGFNLFFLLFWFISKRKPLKNGVISAIYIMLFAAIEFILRVFSNGYSPYLFGIMDLQQFATVIIFIVGVFILIDSSKIKILKLSKGKLNNDGLPKRQEYSNLKSNLSQESRERFSLSYSKIQENRMAANLTPQEKLRIFQNTIKRKIKK